ncbi:transporter [Telluria mixta]|uniref:Transporter n=1 Tax=Telluria mixta TaxID=34071 RepID=A0ABT2C878_9BURK|nr:transporter [Telluria mixta]MCS0633540.1 transporter [Telluria mixta]WEM95993.1 transporter [Telluria mixta]
MPTRHFSCACLLAGILALPAARAADDDIINPDRPDVAESSQVVGAHRVQLEAGLQWDRQRDPDAHVRTLTMPTMLRIGLSPTLELRLETEGRTIAHASNPDTGVHTVDAGWAESAASVKWHVVDQDGMRPSVGLIAGVALPTGSRALRGTGFRPSLMLPADWDLGHDWSLSVMPGVGRDSDEGNSGAGAHYTYGVFAAALGKAFSERLRGFVEVAAPRIARAAHGGTQAVADAGVSWLVNRDCMLDAMVVHGLNRNTPDLSLAFGISVRR